MLNPHIEHSAYTPFIDSTIFEWLLLGIPTQQSLFLLDSVCRSYQDFKALYMVGASKATQEPAYVKERWICSQCQYVIFDCADVLGVGLAATSGSPSKETPLRNDSTSP